MHTLVLLRHGQTHLNAQKRFSGWTESDLTQKGTDEATSAGVYMAEAGLEFDIVYTSILKRAIETARLALNAMGASDTPMVQSWLLNERHYGALQTLYHQDMRDRHGDEQVHLWRRSYDIVPPQLEEDDSRHPAIDPRFASIPKDKLPVAESLEMVLRRVIPYWNETITPSIKSGKRVLISAHGNSLRALIKHLDNISNEDIPHHEVPTGKPLVYELDEDLKPIKHYYLPKSD